MAEPLVGVVVVNYEGGDDTLRCLDSLAGLDWPADRLRVVLVDNASSDGVAARVEAERPGVEVVRSPANVGFAGGCNLGLRRLTDADHVALVNPDAAVEPAWLRALVAAAHTAPDVGAVASKVLLEGTFAAVVIDTPADAPGRGDRRRLGVRVSGARVDGQDAWRDTQFVAGFWGPQHGRGDEATYQWSAQQAVLRVPRGARAQLRLAADRETTVTLTAGGRPTEHAVGRAPAWVDVDVEGPGIDVVNSAGSMLLDDGYGADRGYLEADDGRYDQRDEVFVWSGSAVLLSRAYLRDVGAFDERYFMYYEDFDLSWRGRLLGWRYLYEPAARVRHRHAASSGIGSPLFDHYVERNRLLTVVRNGPGGMAARAVVRFLLITLSYVRRDMVSPPLRGRRPAPTVVTRRCRSFAGFLRLLPAALAHRRRIRRRRRPDDAAVVDWIARA